MRTLSAKPGKGREEPRRLRDDLRLLFTIAGMAVDSLVRGGRIRRSFRSRQRAGQKLYVEEV